MFNAIRNFFAGKSAKEAVVELAQAGDNSDWKPSLTHDEAKAKRIAKKKQKAAKAARRRNRRK